MLTTNGNDFVSGLTSWYVAHLILVFVRAIDRWPVNSPHKRSVTRKMFPFDDVIMIPWKPSHHLRYNITGSITISVRVGNPNAYKPVYSTQSPILTDTKIIMCMSFLIYFYTVLLIWLFRLVWQSTFWNSFSIVVFWFKCHKNLQTIIGTKDSLVYWHIYATEPQWVKSRTPTRLY